MSRVVDARGLSCPQPGLEMLREMKKGQSGEITVLVDTETSRENVIRAADSRGWRVKSMAIEAETYKISIAKA